ncbi:MAG TPA: glycosyltransferase family 2 protein [Candidatus Saccharimonadales bacterium]|nr:glycosyltransferase family 2 protein [Candidatus Saccharimonadales bacterium]
MKLVVQIPCLNEEKTLLMVLKDIPKKIKGIDSIEIIVVDDGCTDKTVEIAKKWGVQHIVTHPQKQGLARSFHDATNKALEIGADIIVNTDGDNQYPGASIPELVRPIIEQRADIVIADRQVQTIEHFSGSKKLLQWLGTQVLNLAAGTKVPDAPSGFRAYSRQAIMRLNVVTTFSYAMEVLIQAGNKKLSIASVPIVVNPKTRESRLFKNHWEYIPKSVNAILRAFVMYRPYVVFASVGTLFLILGAVPFVRYLYFVVADHTSGARHLQSLIFGSVLMAASFIAYTLGVVADLIRINRILIEDGLEHQKHARFDKRR